MARHKLSPEMLASARAQGRRIYEIIKSRGVPQKEMAARLDISPANLSLTLKRVRDGRFTLKTLAALGLSVGIHWDIKLLPKTSNNEMLVLYLAS